MIVPPKSWLEAFEHLKKLIASQGKPKSGKHLLFFDEFPWLATRRSGFLSAFEHFWNTYAERRQDLMVIICGSAASWLIKKVIGSKGGLHNRTTRRIRLEPLTLGETKSYLSHIKIKLDTFQLTQLYMAIGGIPLYLNYIEKGMSVAQNLDQLCFAKDGLLKHEFQHLYAALFDNHHIHEQIVRALAKSGKGLTRNTLLHKAKLTTGGYTSLALEELEQSGFIERIHPINRKLRDSIYRLSDEYTLFYLEWIQKSTSRSKNFWIHQSKRRQYSTWCGYAFESLSLKHISQIKSSLGISGIETTESSWIYQAKTDNEEGAQIDLVIARTDRCINLCEMKFSQDPFTISKKYAQELERKLRVFREKTKTNDTLFLTLVTAHGIKQNEHADRLVSSHVSLEALFT